MLRSTSYKEEETRSGKIVKLPLEVDTSRPTRRYLLQVGLGSPVRAGEKRGIKGRDGEGKGETVAKCGGRADGVERGEGRTEGQEDGDAKLLLQVQSLKMLVDTGSFLTEVSDEKEEGRGGEEERGEGEETENIGG